MPRVTAEHLERRRQQILDAARACFVRKGVHDTSMQDIFTESGLSAGAVYRYFKSKSEIIEAIMSTVIGDMHTFVRGLVEADPLPPLEDVAEAIAARIVKMSENNGLLSMAPQSWALATYDPVMATYVRQNITLLRDAWVTYAERLVEAGRLPADTDPLVVGKTLFGLMPGFLLQRVLLGDVTPEDLREGLKSLTHLNAHPRTDEDRSSGR